MAIVEGRIVIPMAERKPNVETELHRKHRQKIETHPSRDLQKGKIKDRVKSKLNIFPMEKITIIIYNGVKRT